ncbi:hypothetical protein J6590_077602 [Homalodisca vitripennis]|nr:hypothetical protein J6590_077602 [Homalodisca vitripennis]
MQEHNGSCPDFLSESGINGMNERERSEVTWVQWTGKWRRDCLGYLIKITIRVLEKPYTGSAHDFDVVEHSDCKGSLHPPGDGSCLSLNTRVQWLSQDNRIKQRRAWLLLVWVTAERSCPCKQPFCPTIVGVSEVTFKPLVPRSSLREGFFALV